MKYLTAPVLKTWSLGEGIVLGGDGNLVGGA